MKTDFHSVVIARDQGVCQYCALFRGNGNEPATWGDHIVTQAKSRALKLAPWNGIATCDWCNAARDAKLIGACVVVTESGHQQIAWDTKTRHTYGRVLAGEHVGQWLPMPSCFEIPTNHAYDDQGKVLA
jgi:hypothetical protein